jgi:hypothetical protein
MFDFSFQLQSPFWMTQFSSLAVNAKRTLWTPLEQPPNAFVRRTKLEEAGSELFTRWWQARMANNSNSIHATRNDLTN